MMNKKLLGLVLVFSILFIQGASAVSFTVDTSTEWQAGIFTNTTETNGNLKLISYDVSRGNYNGKLNVSSEISSLRGLIWNNNGSRVYLPDSLNDDISEYSCSTPYNISSCGFVDSLDVSSGGDNPHGLAWNNNGSKFYTIGWINNVSEYSCLTPYDISTCSYQSGEDLNVSSEDGDVKEILWNDDGSKFYIIGADNDNIYEYNCSTAYDVSSCSYNSGENLYVGSEDILPSGMAWNGDGSKIYMTGYDNDNVSEYSCLTPYDISTCSYQSGEDLNVSSEDSIPYGVAWNDIGSKVYMAGYDNTTIYEYKETGYSQGVYTSKTFSASSEQIWKNITAGGVTNAHLTNLTVQARDSTDSIVDTQTITNVLNGTNTYTLDTLSSSVNVSFKWDFIKGSTPTVDNTTIQGVTANAAPNKPTLNSPSDTATGVSTSPTLNVTVTDPDGDSMNISFYNDTTNSQIGITQTGIADGGTASVTWSGLSTGTTYNWYANVTDGSLTNTSDTWSFTTEDTTPPTITIHSPTATTYATSSVDLNVTADETINTWLYNLDGNSNQTFSPNITMTGISEGSHTVYVYANDSAGNMGSNSQSFTVDTIPPQYSNDQDDSGGSVTEGTSVTASVYWQDSTSNLGYGEFYENSSGSWTMVDTSSFGAVSSSWYNYTIDTTGDGGKYVCWREYANDTIGNKNTSMIDTANCFDVITDIPLTYSSNSTNGTCAGCSIEHRLKWQDDVGLSGYKFQFCNGTWDGTNCGITISSEQSILTQPDFNSGIFNRTSADRDDNSGNLGIGYLNGTAGDDLVGYWRLDRSVSGTGGNVIDYSGEGNNGTTNGGVTTGATGIFSTDAMKFSTEYIEANAGLQNSTGVTVSVWFYRTDIDDYNTIVAGEPFRFQVSNGNKVRLEFTDGSNRDYVTGATTINQNTWYHAVFTRDSSGNVNLYLDGSSDGSATISYDRAWNNIRIGGDGVSDIGGTDYWDGKIDEVKVYNRVLSQSEVEDLYFQGMDGKFDGIYTAKTINNSKTTNWNKLEVNASIPTDTSLTAQFSLFKISKGISEWRFETGGGTTAYDSWSGDDGTINGANWVSSKGGNYTGDYALEFDGSSDYVEANAGLQNSTGVTVMAWFNKTDPSDWNTMVAGEPFRFEISGGNNLRLGFTDGASYTGFYGNTVINQSTWYHATFTRDSNGNINLYLNGNPDGSSTITYDRAWNNTRIGADGLSGIGAGDYWDGRLDEVRIYDRVLNQSEIETIYETGAEEKQSIDVQDGTQNYTLTIQDSKSSTVRFSGTSTNETKTWEVNDFEVYSQVGASNWVNDTWTSFIDYYPKPDGVSEYRFETGSGSTAYDTWNGNDGVLGNSTVGDSSEPSWISSKSSNNTGNYALDFDGTDDWIEIDSVSSNIAGGAFTWVAWIKTTTTSAPSIISANLADGGNNLLWFVHNGVLDLYDGSHNDGSITVNDGVWHHVAITLDSGGNYQFYVDGSAGYSNSTSKTVNSDDLVSIGQEWDTSSTSNFFDGKIDEVRIYDRALNQSEIQTIYEGKTLNWSNVTKVVNSTVGSEIAWKVYANDTSDQWNSSLTYSYTTTITIEEYLRSASQSITTKGQSSRQGKIKRKNSQSLITQTLSQRILSSFRTNSQSASILQGISKIGSFFRSTTQETLLDTATSRTSSIYRTLTQSFNLNNFSSRLTDITRTINQPFQTLTSTKRTSTVFRTLSQPIQTNTITKSTRLIKRAVHQSITVMPSLQTEYGVNRMWEGSATTKPPLSYSTAGETEITDLSNVSTSDNTYVITNSTDYPYHKFEFSIDKESINWLNITWEGRTSGTAHLYVWNLTTTNWTELDTGSGDQDFTLHKKITSVGGVIDYGKVVFLVQDPPRGNKLKVNQVSLEVGSEVEITLWPIFLVPLVVGVGLVGWRIRGGS